MGSISCPRCGQTDIPAPTNGGGVEECPSCGHAFALPEPALLQRDEAPVHKGEAENDGLVGGPTDVPLASSCLIGLGITGLFYLAVVMPLHSTYFGQLFASRGWVPYAITWFSAWAMTMLWLKHRLYQNQLRVLKLDLLPIALGEKITPQNAHIFASYLQHIAATGPKSFLVQRLHWATRHFEARGDSRELATRLDERNRADLDVVDSSYSLLRVFVWSIPILGFIGTVLGIGASVSGFSNSVASAADLDVMKNSIGSVTTGLGVAFDTTLLALVMSIIVMFPMSWLQKTEEDYLARSDDYCDEHLIYRLDDGRGHPGASEAQGEAAGGRRLPGEVGRLINALGELERRIGRLEPPSEDS